jgi:hypothetical protein
MIARALHLSIFEQPVKSFLALLCLLYRKNAPLLFEHEQVSPCCGELPRAWFLFLIPLWQRGLGDL